PRRDTGWSERAAILPATRNHGRPGSSVDADRRVLVLARDPEGLAAVGHERQHLARGGVNRVDRLLAEIRLDLLLHLGGKFIGANRAYVDYRLAAGGLVELRVIDTWEIGHGSPVVSACATRVIRMRCFPPVSGPTAACR